MAPGSSPAKTCPFCAATGPRVKYRIEDHRILRCPSCDLMWLDPQPTLEELAQVYDQNYFSNPEFFEDDSAIYGYADYISERMNKQREYGQIVERVRERLGGEDGEWLDVGCGLGYLLDTAYDYGFKVTGLEFNPWAVRECQRRYAFPVLLQTPLSEMPDNSYDVVSLMDVIEHFLDPFTELAHIERILKPGGVLVLVTPDARSLASKLLGSRLEDFRRIREHLFFFSRRSITQVLGSRGFSGFEMTYIGHTFQLDQLMYRLLRIKNQQGVAHHLISELRLDRFNVSINPQVKMLLLARKGGDWPAVLDDRYWGPLQETAWLGWGAALFLAWCWDARGVFIPELEPFLKWIISLGH